MDHSPSEQLGEQNQWHTTVIILSEGGEHFQLASDIAQAMRCGDRKLRKWSKNPLYRRDGSFERALGETFGAYPVHIRAISARASTIRYCFDHMCKELGLSGLVESYEKNKKRYFKFGPFERVVSLDAQSPERHPPARSVFFTIPERQGIPLVFICHYLLRMHQQMLKVIQNTSPHIEWVDWQVMPNKFPGDIKGPMASLFSALMSGASHQRLAAGNIRIATFVNAVDDVGSNLADNIAGMIADKLKHDGRGMMPPIASAHRATMLFEILESA